MKISAEQLSILDSLVVERLTENPVNTALANTFKSSRNPNLEIPIKTRVGFDRDKDGSTAYYVVKTNDGVLLLYFSLKCGEVFKSLDMSKMIMARNILDNYSIITNQEDREQQEIEHAMNFFRDNSEEIKNILPNIGTYLSKKGEYAKDVRKELNTEVSRVLHTHSAIEIVEFCANDNALERWNAYELPQKMGKCVFWHCIVPILKSVQKIIGCEYVYLFAADNTPDRYLANYYQVELKFETSDIFGANKPRYDFMCYFLLQKISHLYDERDNFYNNFNPDEDIADII